MAQTTEHRSFEQPDEVREFPNGRAEILKVGGVEIGRLVFRPGWRWSKDLQTHRRHRQLHRPTLPVPRVGTTGHLDGRRD